MNGFFVYLPLKANHVTLFHLILLIPVCPHIHNLSMSSPLDEMTKLLAGLSLGSNCMKALESLRILLASVSLSELKDYAPKIDIDRIYKCLSTSNS